MNDLLYIKQNIINKKYIFDEGLYMYFSLTIKKVVRRGYSLYKERIKARKTYSTSLTKTKSLKELQRIFEIKEIMVNVLFEKP